MKRAAAVIAVVVGALTLQGHAQSSNQPIYIQYDGFVRNPEAKTITLSFGYWNLNHADVKVEPGADNGFVPGPADRQQPITLLEGRHRFACTIVVPDDFKGDLKWQIHYAGKTNVSTEKVFNSLYELERSSANRAMSGVDPKTAPRNVCANHAPSVTVGAAAGGGGGGDAAGVPDVGDDSVGPAAVAASYAVIVAQDLALPGNVSDDELPRGRTLKINWTKKSGPGDVTFTSTTTAATRATFSAVGVYEIALTATDGDRTTETPVRITVNPVGTTILTEKAPDSYSKAMKDIQAAQAPLRTSIGSKNYDGIARQVATLKSAFTVTQEYWTGKAKADAVTAANSALKALADLDTAAKARNDPKLIEAQTALSRTCTSCHSAHRQSVGAGAFEIK